MIDHDAWARCIKAARVSARQSQWEVAEAAGVSTDLVGKCERGHVPQYKIIVKLAAALKLDRAKTLLMTGYAPTDTRRAAAVAEMVDESALEPTLARAIRELSAAPTVVKRQVLAEMRRFARKARMVAS